MENEITEAVALKQLICLILRIREFLLIGANPWPRAMCNDIFRHYIFFCCPFIFSWKRVLNQPKLEIYGDFSMY